MRPVPLTDLYSSLVLFVSDAGGRMLQVRIPQMIAASTECMESTACCVSAPVPMLAVFICETLEWNT